MNQTLQQRLQNLNKKQLQAVETIEGPVMVIAGPGTGKTEVLSARIANILQTTDAGPHNILCLTYTDAGTIAMRKRLLEFIGPEAYKVNIHTFHSFCNEVIQANLDYFGKRELSLVSPLETVQFLENLIDGFAQDHPLYHVSSYYEVERLKNLFETMKAENWSEKDISLAADEYLKSLNDDPEFQYKRADKTRGIEKGDVKEHLISVERDKMQKLVAGAKEFKKYQEFLAKTERYDYQDMIAWVVKAFQENENILAANQERFLYILVDEYQDTNGAQNEIIDLLTNFWDNPNVFIVGDDDQSIYRFQGANLRNIMSFYHKHPNAKKITITQNYRSSKNILDTAQSLIEENTERLISEIPELEKNLQASSVEIANSEVKPRIFEYHNTAHEEAGLVEILEKLHKNGTDLNEVAVIYKEHKQAFNIIKLLEEKGVPLNVKESTNILELPFIKTIINILSYISGEFEDPYSMESTLFHILHYDFFKISTRDIAMLSAKLRHLSKEHRRTSREANTLSLPTLEPRLRELIADRAMIQELTSTDSQEKILRLGEGLGNFIGLIPHKTLQELVEMVFSEAGILEYVMNSDEKIWHMRILTTFFNFIKDECHKNPHLTLKEFLKMLAKMEAHGIKMPLAKMTFAKQGVNFVTAHSSKGLEFKYVFLIGCQKNIWDEGRSTRGRFSFPNTLTLSNTGDNTEEARRLFYVAMTRAKEYLIMTYSAKDQNDKELEMSRFLAEIIAKSGGATVVEPKVMSDEAILLYHHSLMSRAQAKNTSIIEKEYLTEILKDYKLSPTHLNKYLECPVAFYFENILQVPKSKHENLAFGTAIHYALEHFFKNAKDCNMFGAVDKLLGYFKYAMELNRAAFTDTQYKKRMEYGMEVLQGYFEQHNGTWDTNVRLEYNIWNAHMAGVPITGKIDKVEFLNPNEVNVVDYKTGNFTNAKDRLESPSENNPKGGDYWRQIVFYKILTDSDKREPWSMISGEMDFVEKDSKSGKYQKIKIDVRNEDIEIVKHQIKDVYDRIMNHKFNEGCDKPDCEWCEFLKSEYGAGRTI